MANSGYSFILANWRYDANDIRSIREPVLREVFGQLCEFGAETDEEGAYHVLAYDAAGRPVGVARMQADGCIDYVAVHKPWRGVTVGGALLAFLLHIARKCQLEQVWCSVPTEAQRFFARNGFMPASDAGSAGPDRVRWVRQVTTAGQTQGALH